MLESTTIDNVLELDLQLTVFNLQVLCLLDFLVCLWFWALP